MDKENIIIYLFGPWVETESVYPQCYSLSMVIQSYGDNEEPSKDYIV